MNIDDDTYYEVEKIVDHAFDARGMLFRVRWKGYMAIDDTWEHENCFLDPQFVQNYISNLNVVAENNIDNEDDKMKVKSFECGDALVNASRIIGHLDVSPKKQASDVGTLVETTTRGADDFDDTETDSVSSEQKYSFGYVYDHFLNYHIDWRKNRVNWRPAQIINERKSCTGRGKELMVRWQHVENHWQTFHSWEPENNLDCSQVILKYYLDLAKANNQQALSKTSELCEM